MNALPPITPSDASRIRRAALALLRRNRRVASHPLDGRPLRYSCPSPGHYPFQWFWDSCFHAVALAHPEPDAAREELELLVSTQRPDGFLPHVNFWERRRLAGPGLYWAWMQSRSWGFPRTSALIQPPVLAIALERYVEITGDRSLVALLRPRVERYFAFLARERSPGPTGLLAIVAPWESGMDHSPIYDGALRLPYPARPRDLVLRPRLLDMANRRLGNDPRRLNRHGRFLVQDVLVNAVYADGLRSLARLQRTVLQDGAGADSDARAARVEAAILAQLRGDDGFFYPRDLRTGTLLPVRTVAGLMPLLAGSFSADDLRPLLTSLDDPQGFSTPFPAPSVAVAEPAFTPGPLSWRVGPLIWRGPSWINTNWLLRRALLRRGDERRADRLARSSAALVLHSGFHEYFNPLTGSGHGAPGFGRSTLPTPRYSLVQRQSRVDTKNPLGVKPWGDLAPGRARESPPLLKRLPALAAAVLAVLLPAVLTLPRVAAQSAPAAASLKLPLPGGSAWKVIQGYNGGTHVAGPEQYALDLARDGGPTAGTEIVAPAAGAVWFAHPPGAGNGCASIKLDGGDGLIVQMCHIILHRALRADERITAGQSLGAIGEDGRVGNNGTAHVHLSIHRTPDYGVTRIPYAFSTVGGGLPLEGINLPPNGSFNQYACPGPGCMSRLISTIGTSGVVAGQLPPAAAPPLPAVAAPGMATPVPAISPISPLAPAAPRPSAPPAPPAPPTGPLRPGVRAVVANAGSGDCVNIREGPTTDAQIRQCLPDGARLRIVEGPVSADGYQWWRLEGLGWAAGMYLSPLAPSLEVGGRARVNAGAGDCLNARAAPGIIAQRAGCLAHGTAVRIVAGPLEADGVTWWQVEGGAWLAGEYLVPDE